MDWYHRKKMREELHRALAARESLAAEQRAKAHTPLSFAQEHFGGFREVSLMLILVCALSYLSYCVVVPLAQRLLLRLGLAPLFPFFILLDYACYRKFGPGKKRFRPRYLPVIWWL
jgi:hypothetical protein